MCYGHIQSECANFLKSKGKALNATQSDDSDSKDKKDTSNEVANYVAFTASYESSHESSKYTTPNLHDSSDGESEEEDNLQAAYNNLFVKFSKLKRLSEKVFKKLKEIELEK